MLHEQEDLPVWTRFAIEQQRGGADEPEVTCCARRGLGDGTDWDSHKTDQRGRGDGDTNTAEAGQRKRVPALHICFCGFGAKALPS